MGTSSWNDVNAVQFRRMFFDRELMQYRNVVDAGDELVQRKNRTQTITGGKARGELVGGNLSVLVALAGSPYVPDFKGRILFLEDVDEAPYRVDRMLTTLKLMGALDGRSEEHTSELQSLMRISYAVFCLKKKKNNKHTHKKSKERRT